MLRTTILVLILSVFTCMGYSQTVNGDVSKINGVKVLRVWGTHYERGYAQGYLVPEDCRETFKIVLVFFYYNNASAYEAARQFYLDNYTVEQKYSDEDRGVIDGIIASGISPFNEILGRDLTYNDFLAATAVLDLVYMPGAAVAPDGNFDHCATLSSWGASTAGDQELNGELVVTRHMDYPFQNYPVSQYNLTIHYPSEDGELNWVHLSNGPGNIGSLSSFNELGFALFNNDGNHVQNSNLTDLYPTPLTERNCIEVEDGNGDGSNDLNDFIWQRDQHSYLYSSILTCVSPDSAIILETNNSGATQRSVVDNTVISGQNLAATNHFRELNSPASCSRYNKIKDSLNVDSNMSIERSWDLMGGAAGVSSNLQKMEYIPALKLLKYTIVGTDGTPAYQNEPASFNTDFLFSRTPVATASIVSPLFAQPGIDSVMITADISNPLQNNVEVKALIVSANASVIDSIILWDNGIGADSTAGDGQYSSSWPVTSDEGFYTVRTKVENTDSNYIHINEWSRLTTAGPIIFETYETPYNENPPTPGSDVYFQITLRNDGSVTAATDVSIQITTDADSFLTLLSYPHLEFGDIPADSLVVSTGFYSISLNNDIPVNEDITFYTEIFSEDNFFWNDSFTVHVYPLGIAGEEGVLPDKFALHQNYPNPFNPVTTIHYDLPNQSDVQITIYDLMGREVNTLISESQEAGYKSIQWNATNIPSGMYFYQIRASDFVQTKKLILLK